MRRPRLTALALLPFLSLSACVATTTTTRTWGGQGDEDVWERPGRVESVRETIRRQEGDPAAGAVAGAIIGGLVGSVLFGHTWYDRRGYAHSSGSPGGAVAGAVGGAMLGAASSQGSAEDRSYEVFVRFDDGARQRFVFRGYLPFAVGDAVVLTPQGLARQ